MKKMNKARQVSDPLLGEILSTITPLEKEKTRVSMELAARIAECMGESEISKSGLASKVAKQPSEVTKWLSGTHNFTISTLVEICAALGIKIDQLFRSKEPPIPELLSFTIYASRKRPGGSGGFGGNSSKARPHRPAIRDHAYSSEIDCG